MSVGRSGRPASVLVVEDEPLVRMVMVEELEEAGFHVVEAESGDEGLREIERHPDLRAILTDIEMPGSIDGVALARVTNERYPNAAVIVMSGRRRPGRGDLPDSARFFSKPYRHAEVIAALHELMSRN